MKFKDIIFSALLTILMVGCDKSEPFDGEVEVFERPKFNTSIASGKKMQEMYEKYNVLFISEYKLEDIRYDWNEILEFNTSETSYYTISPANESYVVATIDSVESWVLSAFPLEFAKKYSPLNIVLADTMSRKYATTFNTVTQKYNVVHQLYEGFITKNNTILSSVSPRFDEVKSKRILREAWMSLFIERMFNQLPAVSDFAPISQEAYARSSFPNADDVMAKYALVKRSRLKQTGSSATSTWGKVTLAQDFGDFVAFIVYTPDAEKQVAYSKNANIFKKVNIVKAYFKENFNIELPYRPIAN
ncbi:hypothetical protein [Sphingobacterium bovistauri]|uniref:Beta-lactamase class A n=1 Tax=Sphingobacterium bovistauri TaxID=2781959 RepID=A0ABS7Z4V6_9SPHI|nr:hypothetical protein [Sphingobacterium bovistauri]MCA5003999.1 hypothetical protein [Sphingobacterium bovistauri]